MFVNPQAEGMLHSSWEMGICFTSLIYIQFFFSQLKGTRTSPTTEGTTRNSALTWLRSLTERQWQPPSSGYTKIGATAALRMKPFRLAYIRSSRSIPTGIPIPVQHGLITRWIPSRLPVLSRDNIWSYTWQGIVATAVACAVLRQQQQVLNKNKTFLKCNLFQGYIQVHQIIYPCTEQVTFMFSVSKWWSPVHSPNVWVWEMNHLLTLRYCKPRFT